MQRIVVNVMTGAQEVVDLTPEEISEIENTLTNFVKRRIEHYLKRITETRDYVGPMDPLTNYHDLLKKSRIAFDTDKVFSSEGNKENPSN